MPDILAFNSYHEWWRRNSRNPVTRTKVTIISLFVIIAVFIMAGLRIPVISVIGAILMGVALHRAEKTNMDILFLFGACLLLLQIGIVVMAIVALVGLYELLESRRVKRVKRISMMNPSSLSKIKYKEPAVEIVVRRGKRE